MHDELREQLIRQFQSEVLEITNSMGGKYYICPVCRRAVSMGQVKCTGCGQALSWNNIQKEILERTGMKKGYIELELPADFSLSDCRRCPLSFIARKDGDLIYECQLNCRASCKIKIME